METLPERLSDVELVTVAEAFLRADVHVYLVAHREFKAAAKPLRFVIDTVGL